MPIEKKQKIAIIHYWILDIRGGEKVIDALLDIYPNADIYTIFSNYKYWPLKTDQKIRIHASWLNKFSFLRKRYKNLLPVLPFAIEAFDLSGYDLIISSESGPAKGIIPPPNAVHICYCHSPMRYLWDQRFEYLRGASSFKKLLYSFFSTWLRVWDVTTAQRVQHFIANSSYVKKRIAHFYQRDAAVIHPPVDVAKFHNKKAKDYFFILSQLVPYKKIEIAVRAFNVLGEKLIIAGDGSELKSLKKMANKNIEFVGQVSDQTATELYAECRAFVFPGIEDFGITMVEAMSAGKPVIAFQEGGALDIVKEGMTGIFFEKQSSESLVQAIKHFMENEVSFDPVTIQNEAKKFSKDYFLNEIKDFIEKHTK